MGKLKLSQFIPFSTLLIAIYSIQYQSKYPIDNTALWWMILSTILIAFWKARNIFADKANIQGIYVIKWYLTWNVCCIIYGCFVAESYWHWKGLVSNSMGLLLPIVAYTATNKEKMQDILAYYIKYALPLFIPFALIISTDVYGFYLVPISFLLLFIPALTIRSRILLLIVTFIVLVADLGARSNIIRFVLPLALLLIYYFRVIIPHLLIELTRLSLIFAPLIFLILAITGNFNLFKMEEYIQGNYVEVKSNSNGEIVENNLTADTRTFLYLEVLQTTEKHNTWLIGRSPARGNESESFGSYDLSGKNERSANEVAILNIFSWTGIIGILLYFLVFYKASYLAINQSTNIFSKILGIFIAFRWSFAWVEDINEFKLNYFMLWLMIGLCFSKSFREMTNEEVRRWVRGVFDKRYRQTIPVVNK